MVTPAFDPDTATSNELSSVEQVMTDMRKACAVTVTIAGCGGAGVNLGRSFVNHEHADVIYFDTSMANSRNNERVYQLSSGNGSGSHRAENAKDIESKIPQIPKEVLLDNDVAIVCFSLAGGSGSVVGPLLIRHYAKTMKKRVIAVAIADTESAIGAKNTINTLKTLSAITKNNSIYLPMVILSNNLADTRGQVDLAATTYMDQLVTLLTSVAYEVDRNDRLNWIDPSKVIGAEPGIKLIKFFSDNLKIREDLIMGTDSTEMVDTLLVLQGSPEETGSTSLPRPRLKKMGFYADLNGTRKPARIVGSVSSDISSVEKIISQVEETQSYERSQRHSKLDALDTHGSDDMIL